VVTNRKGVAMLGIVVALLAFVAPSNWAGIDPFDSGWIGHSSRTTFERPAPSLAAARSHKSLNYQQPYAHLVLRVFAQAGDTGELQFPPTILGKWCNDHDEIWVFGAEYLTHRLAGRSHEHRVRYKWNRNRMTVYVDGYPDEFLPLTPDGTRMKLLSSGLDSTMKGWLFWRCPDLHS